MSVFAFRAVDLAGVPSRGELEAASKAHVSEQLRQRGLIVLDVSEKREALRLEGLFKRFRNVRLRSLAVFSRQFATLVASGMPMLRALHTLEDQSEDEVLKEAIVGVRQDIEAGGSVASAMDRHPRIFDSLYRSVVRAGEGSGRLAPPGALGEPLPRGRVRLGDRRHAGRCGVHRSGVRRHLRRDRRG
jgi:type IV pilus assembly protein PilC